MAMKFMRLLTNLRLKGMDFGVLLESLRLRGSAYGNWLELILMNGLGSRRLEFGNLLVIDTKLVFAQSTNAQSSLMKINMHVSSTDTLKTTQFIDLRLELWFPSIDHSPNR